MRKKTEDKTTPPMDSTVIENKVGTPKPNNGRVCWALKTLNAEFQELFPETPVEYSNRDGRNVALDVTYDLSALVDAAAVYDASALLRLVVIDQRVETVIIEEDSALVSMKASARTQDLRDPFGLADALMILGLEPEEEFSPDGGGAASTSDGALNGGTAAVAGVHTTEGGGA